ncbi:MAG: TVP38/TMEM64 family protein [Dehalococcoidia bacterium]|nr:TVP38/TMEM64 family protein [Dehalococcoidia bacterium]
MRARIPVVLGLVVGLGVAAAAYYFLHSKGIAGGLGLVAGYFAWGELGDLFAGPDRNRVEPGTPIFLNPVIRRRLLGILALAGASGLVVLELMIGEIDSADIREQVNDLGAWGPILLITVLAVAMVVAPIPNPPFMIAAGIVWGTFWGVIYSVAGQLIGSAIIFFVSRKFGRQFIPKLVGEEATATIDRIAKDMGPQIVFWWRMMPVSFDFAAYAAGLTTMSFRLFIVLVFLGSIVPTTVVVSFGDSFDSSWTARGITLVLIALGVSVPATIFYLRNRSSMPPLSELVRGALGDTETKTEPAETQARG